MTPLLESWSPASLFSLWQWHMVSTTTGWLKIQFFWSHFHTKGREETGKADVSVSGWRAVPPPKQTVTWPACREVCTVKGPVREASSKEEVKSRRLLGDKKLFSCFRLGFPSVPSGFFWAKHQCQWAFTSLVGGVWRDTGPALPISFSHSVLNARCPYILVCKFHLPK